MAECAVRDSGFSRVQPKDWLFQHLLVNNHRCQAARAAALVHATSNRGSGGWHLWHRIKDSHIDGSGMWGYSKCASLSQNNPSINGLGGGAAATLMTLADFHSSSLLKGTCGTWVNVPPFALLMFGVLHCLHFFLFFPFFPYVCCLLIEWIHANNCWAYLRQGHGHDKDCIYI